MTPTLIGRQHPTEVLRAEINRTAGSHGGLVLVAGEAGIGKTTLVTAVADEARRLGALVLSGSCWDSDSAPGYWPWVQVIRGLRRSVSHEEWAAAEEVTGAGLSVLLGEAPGTDEAETTEVVDAFPLYDAVTTALVSVSHRRPVVVVLDDLHWADTASVRLLEFAAQHTWFERLLLVGTYRDVEVESAEHPLRRLMLPLVAKATTVTLTGLSRDEVGALMARTVDREPDPDLVTEVHLRTGGNPFFVEQTARLWRSGGSMTAVAPGVREALHRRLSLLPAPVGQLLTTAAFLGREFHRQVLAAVAAAPVPHVDRLLDQAVTARLAVVQGAGRFAFAHDLVRETLYHSLDEAEVRRRHAEVVRALDQSPALAERIFPADLARHAYLAGGELEPARARELLVAAGRDASSRLAAEEAIAHYRRALELVDDDHQRATIALHLGQELRHSGDRAEAWRSFADAAASSRRAGEPGLLARVAITLCRYDAPGDRQQLKDAILREAHRELVGGDAPPDGEARAEHLVQDLIQRTSALARRGNDDEALGFSLSARHDTIWGPGTAPEREALTEEMEAVGRRTADHDLESYASSLRWVALLEQGDPRYLGQFRAFVALAERHDTPRMSSGSVVDQSIIAGLMGRFEEAMAHLDRLKPGEHDHAEFTHMVQHIRWALLLRQGRFAEVDALLRQVGEIGYPRLRLIEAITAVERGDHDLALRHLAEVEAQQEPYPRSYLPLWLRFQAQAAAISGDPVRCARARAALAPHTGEWAVSLYGCDISGPVDLWLAVLDAAEERWDDAIDRCTAAYRSADRLQARPWSIEARCQLGQALLGRGAGGDAEAGERMLVQVASEADAIGMPHIATRARRGGSGVPSTAVGSTAQRVAAPTRAEPVDEFRWDGAVWSLGFAGRTVHVPDAKGLRDLHFLLNQPGRDVPAVELLDPQGGAVVVAARRMGGDPILDEEAKAQYRRRLAQLDEEIDRVTERGDDRRAIEYDRERQALLDELRTAAGLAGRSRRLGDEAERARKTVTARIRDTLRKLDEHQPDLGAHLRATVSTGTTCRYQPDQEIDWKL